MALELNPTDVETFTGRKAAAEHIAVAAELIHTETGSTVDEHVTARSIADTSVRAAWAIVAVRVAEQMTTSPVEQAVTSESEGDYTYSRDADLAVRAADLLAGMPRKLLRLGLGTWYGSEAINDPHSTWWDDPSMFPTERTVYPI